LNRRRKDFQSFALPTELSRHLRMVVTITKRSKEINGIQFAKRRRLCLKV